MACHPAALRLNIHGRNNAAAMATTNCYIHVERGVETMPALSWVNVSVLNLLLALQYLNFLANLECHYGTMLR